VFPGVVVNNTYTDAVTMHCVLHCSWSLRVVDLLEIVSPIYLKKKKKKKEK